MPWLLLLLLIVVVVVVVASRQATLQQAKSQFAVQLQLMTSARETVVVSFNPLIDAVVVVVVVVVRRGHSVDTLWTHTHTVALSLIL